MAMARASSAFAPLPSEAMLSMWSHVPLFPAGRAFACSTAAVRQIDGRFLFDAFQAPDMNIHQTAVVSYVIADKADVATADRPVVFVQISNKSFQWRNSYYLLLAVYDGKSVFIRKYN